MEYLKELIQIISKRKLSQIEMFDKSLISKKDTLFSKLYDGIESGKIQKDDDAITLLYGDGQSDSSSYNKRVAYRRLKSRFRERLYNTLYFLDLNQSSASDFAKREYADCLNKLYLSNLLLRYADNRNASIHLVQEAYPIAEKNNFYDLLREFSFKLLVYYGMNGKTKLYNEELKKYELYKQEYDVEQKAQLIYSKVYLLSNTQKYDPDELSNEMQDEINKLIPLYKNSSSINPYFSYIRTELFYYAKFSDNTKILSICDEFLSNYHKYKHSILLQNYIDIIQMHKLKTLFDVREYEMCNTLCLQLESNAKSLNWLSVKEFQFKTLLNQNIDRKPILLSEEVMSSSHYKASPNYIKERWLIFHAFATLMNQYSTQVNYKININKLSNQLTTLSQDKTGYNLSFRVLEIIYSIARNDLDSASDKINALISYQKRHLKDEKHIRFALFLELLAQAEKRGFNYKELKNLKQYTLLKENYKKQPIEDYEILSHDRKWEIILEMLRSNDSKLLNQYL